MTLPPRSPVGTEEGRAVAACGPVPGEGRAAVRRGPALGGIAFFGGGTGGHIFPGIAVAERARERFPGVRIVFFRTARAVEDRVFGGRDFEILPMAIDPPGRRPSGWMRYVRQVQAATREALRVLGGGEGSAGLGGAEGGLPEREGTQPVASRAGRSDGGPSRGMSERGASWQWVAFGLGGYASLPGLLAARKRRFPAILLEQNRRPGKATRFLAPWAQGLCLSYPETRVRFARRSLTTGNPVRKEVLAAAERRTLRPRSSQERLTVLVVGGSQGARGINRAIRESLPHLAAFSERIRWIHLTGDADKEDMREAYRQHGWEAEVLAYSPDLPDLMARSDLVVSRAGGTTLAEIAAIGIPSVLVPYPHHGDRHQLWNARYLAERGAARIVEEKMLGRESLHKVFEGILFVPERLEAMGRSARSSARPMAADAVLDLAVDLSRSCPSLSDSSC